MTRPRRTLKSPTLRQCRWMFQSLASIIGSLAHCQWQERRQPSSRHLQEAHLHLKTSKATIQITPTELDIGYPTWRARARAAQHSRPRRTVSTRRCHTPVRPPTLDCAVRLRLRRTHVLCRLRLGSCARNSAVPPPARMDGRRDSRRTGCTGGFAATYSAFTASGCGAGGRSGSASRRSQRQRPTSHATCTLQHATCTPCGSAAHGGSDCGTRG